MTRRWAEWLTVVVTSSFIPVEVYEMVEHFSAGKVVALTVNVAIVVHLVVRRLADREHRPARTAGAPFSTYPAPLLALLELRDELPGQRWNKGLQAVFPDLGPVIHARRGVRAVERAHLDGITRHAPFEVVADVFLAALCRHRER